MICTRYLLPAVAVASLLIAGCGGGGGGGGSGSNSETVPSLGMIRDATVTFYRANDPACPDNCPVLSTGTTGTSGVIIPNISGYNGPLVIEVSGNASAQYFDESLMVFVPFPAGEKLRAITPTAQGRFGVTVLTELAYQQALRENSFPLNAAAVNSINTNIKNALAPGLNSILTVPTLFADEPGLNSLQNNQGSLYAVYLAGFAKLGAGEPSPALAVLNALVADIQDGNIDGQNNGTPLAPVLYTDLASDLKTAMQDFVSSYGNPALQGKVSTIPDANPVVFTPPIPGIALTQPANNAVIPQSNADGQVDLALTVATTNFDLADGGWRLHINETAEPGSYTGTSVVHSTELAPGNYILVVELLDHEHRSFEPPVFSTVANIQITAFETDIVPPVLTVPAAITLDAPVGETGLPDSTTEIAAFLAGATAVDAVDGDLTASITHDAPADFPIGTTTVTFTVTDAAGNIATDTSTVTINETAVTPTWTITGTISGVIDGEHVQWETHALGGQYHDGQDGNGPVSFTFEGQPGLSDGTAYSIVVTYPPAGQTCEVINGSGTLTANVSNVQIQCEDIATVTWNIGGNISGASSNVGWALAVGGTPTGSGSDGNGGLFFATGIADGSSYVVSVSAHPAGQTCIVTNGSGTLTASISNVQITCSDNEPGEPSDALYDFSNLNLVPVVPTDMVPSAPTRSPLNPADKIANLYQQLGAAQRAKIIAPKPENTITSMYSIDTNSQTYTLQEYVSDNSWYRRSEIGFGPDQQPNTADDVVRAYVIYPDGTTGVSYAFSHPGEDGIWFTEDDVPGSYWQAQPVSFPTGAVLEYEGASEGAVMIIPCLNVGDDRQLFTEDDSPNGCTSSFYQIVILDGEGHRGQVVTYNGAGDDGLWFTDDDRVQNYTLATFNEAGVSVAVATYNGAGSNGTWFDGDDAVQQHTLTKLDENYKPTYTALYNNRGSDTTWFTEDDVVSAWTYYGYDANGNNVLTATYTNKGGDGNWFTNDDSATGILSLKDEDGRVLLSANVTNRGPDGKWLSDDDTLQYNQYSHARYDEHGRQTHNAASLGKGPDNKWFTADDVPGSASNYWQREYDTAGRITKTVNYNPALAAGTPAFSDAQVSQYTATDHDAGVSVTVYRDSGASSFGGDQLPFTEDDVASWPYSKAVSPTRTNTYNRPGPDGEWFTPDDVISGYALSTYDGDLEIQRTTYDASDVVTACQKVTYRTSSEYRLNYYEGDCAGGTLASYSIIELDANGYTLLKTDYNNSDVATYATYTEHDADGNLVRQGWGLVMTYYMLQSFNDAGELVSVSYQYAGPDELLDTSDDDVQLSSINKLVTAVNDMGTTNLGVAPLACNDLAGSASGSINLLVRDQHGAALPDVTVQLNQSGTTETTDANGEASFAGLTGVQDVHLFKDGYSWESFYCVAPGADVTLKGKLASLTELAHTSRVGFYMPSASSTVAVRLLDEQGNSLATLPQGSMSYGDLGSSAPYAELVFNLPVGTEVTGELWVFKLDNFGALLDAVSLGEQTYTTLSATGSMSLADRHEIAPEFASPAPARVNVARPGKVAHPFRGSNTAMPFLSIGEHLFLLTHAGWPSQYSVPDVALPVTTLAGLVVNAENWKVRLPGSYPGIGDGEPFVADDIRTSIQTFPLVTTQQDGGSNPVVHWQAARLLENDGQAVINTLELHATAGYTGYVPHWTIHLPGGEEEVTLPTPPATITDAVLPNSSYRLLLRTRVIGGDSYHSVVAAEDLHDLGWGVASEEVLSSSSVFLAPQLLR